MPGRSPSRQQKSGWTETAQSKAFNPKSAHGSNVSAEGAMADTMTGVINRSANTRECAWRAHTTSVGWPRHRQRLASASQTSHETLPYQKEDRTAWPQTSTSIRPACCAPSPNRLPDSYNSLRDSLRRNRRVFRSWIDRGCALTVGNHADNVCSRTSWAWHLLVWLLTRPRSIVPMCRKTCTTVPKRLICC